MNVIFCSQFHCYTCWNHEAYPVNFFAVKMFVVKNFPSYSYMLKNEKFCTMQTFPAMWYLGSSSILGHSVPCCNKQCGWSEVTRGWKQLLQLITSSLEKGDIRCLPAEYVPKSCNVNVIPERSNQWKASKWKHLREGGNI